MQTHHRGVIVRQKKKLQVREKFICRSNVIVYSGNVSTESSACPILPYFPGNNI